MKTLYVSDLDGTLLDNKAELTPGAARELNELIDQGVNFTYATGRSWSSAYKVVKDLNLKLPVITHNGAFISKPSSGDAIRMFSMSAEKSANMLSALRARDMYPVVFALVDGAERILWIKGEETDGVREFLEFRRNDSRLFGVDSWLELARESVYEILVIGSNDELAPIAAMVEHESGYCGIFYKYIRMDRYLYEIYDEQASKASGIEWFRENYDFDKIICFGDNLNDISMFEAADEAYAPENALPELKQIATGIIGSNEEGAVVEFIKKVTKWTAIL